jgi:predicted DNA binding CopG/RHH family protein
MTGQEEPRRVLLRLPPELLLQLDRSAAARGISRQRLILEHLRIAETLRAWVIYGPPD